MTPARAVILAIDPGKRSGWCVRAGSVATSESATDCDGRKRAIEVGIEVAKETGLPLVVVSEMWSRHGKWSHMTQAGLSAEWGKWLGSLEAASGLAFLPKLGRCAAYRGIVRVSSNLWYRLVIGHSGKRGARNRHVPDDRDERLARTMQRMECNDPDEACARAIATWASLAPEVDAVLPTAFRRQAIELKGARR